MNPLIPVTCASCDRLDAEWGWCSLHRELTTPETPACSVSRLAPPTPRDRQQRCLEAPAGELPRLLVREFQEAEDAAIERAAQALDTPALAMERAGMDGAAAAVRGAQAQIRLLKGQPPRRTL